MTTNMFTFMADSSTLILHLSKSGIRANPDIPVNEAARAVLNAMEVEIKRMVETAVTEEREACTKVCEAIAQQMEDEGEGPTGYIGWVIDCVAAIRARSNT